MKIMTRLLFVWIGLTLTSAQAGVFKNMQSFFNKFGAVSNVSKGSAFQDQSAGYVTGGSLFLRNPVRSQRLTSLTPPGYRVGCGGIDLWAGGFSYINKEQLRGMMQSIISNMASYAFMLAIETYAPQIHTIMHQLNKLAADFNRLNINSCESAAALVGTAWPKSDLGSQAVCRMLSAHQGTAPDWAGARHECGRNRDAQLGAVAPRELLVGEFNLAWKVIEEMDISFEDSETNLNPFEEEALTSEENQTLKEILMTVSGTIIHRKKPNGTEEHITLRGKGDQEGFINALMSGGRIRYYKCDEANKCLHPRETELVLVKEQSLHSKIQHALADLVAKIQNDTGEEAATPAQKAIVNISTLPIYKIINVTTAFQKGRAPISIQEYSELIAFDVLYRYLNEVFTAFQENANRLREQQFSDEYLKEFLEGIRESKKNLAHYRHSLFAKMDMMLGFMEKVRLIESQIHHMLGALSHD